MSPGPDEEFLSLHGLAIKKFGGSTAVAAVTGQDADTVAVDLAGAVATGETAAARGGFMLTPKGQAALKAKYGDAFAFLRDDKTFVAVYDRFEALNTDLKQLMTDWQVMEVAGEEVPNDHGDKAYDDKIIDRLGALHEKAEPVLADCAAALPRLKRYAERLQAALVKAEEGETSFVSGAKIDSYHTVWFELHEDLLRILDRKRTD